MTAACQPRVNQAAHFGGSSIAGVELIRHSSQQVSNCIDARRCAEPARSMNRRRSTFDGQEIIDIEANRFNSPLWRQMWHAAQESDRCRHAFAILRRKVRMNTYRATGR